MNNKRNSSSSFNWKKVVGIVAGVLVVAALIVSLVSCQKKKSDSDKPKERKVEEKDKKPKKKKDDEKLEVVDEDVVIYSDFSNENSTAKVTNMSNNTNKASKKEEKKEEKKDDDPVDTTAPEISEVTKAIVQNTNTIALTFTVTDESEITEVKVGDEVLTAVDGQYKFIATANGSYTITAKDEYGNESTPKTVEVTELIDNDEFEDAIKIVEETGPGPKPEKKMYKTDNVTTTGYIHTKNEHSELNNTDSFLDGNGNLKDKVTVSGEGPHGEAKDIKVEKIKDNGSPINDGLEDKHYYVYYEVSKKTSVGTATGAYVKHIDNSGN